MKKSCRAKVLLRIPPIARAGGTAASAKDALVHAIELGAILLCLEVLLARYRRWGLPLEPRLNALVLIVEIGHVHNKILDNKHVRKGSYGGFLRRVGVNLG